MTTNNALLTSTIDAEAVLLGGLLVNAENFDEAQELLTPVDFFRRAHQLIFDAMLRLASAGSAIDPFTVQHTLSPRELDEVGKVYLFDIVSGIPNGMHVGHYAKIVREYAIRRELEAHGNRLVEQVRQGEQSAETLLTDAEITIDQLRGRAIRVEILDPHARANAAFQQLEAIQSGRGLRGVTTGLKALDADLRGLHPGNLVLVGARPSQGKSCLALTMAMAAAHETQKPALFFSLEMSAEELNLRELTMRAQVDGWRLTHNALGEVQTARVVNAIQEICDGGVHVIDSPSLTVSKIRVLARRARATVGLSMIVIDYLQLLDDGRERGDTRALALGDISRGLKVLARELDVPVVALSQLNRNVEERPDKMPRLSDLRESGSLEQDADVVLLIYRPAVYFPEKYQDNIGETQIIVAKQRNGPTGTVLVEFIPEQTRFTDKRAAA